MNSPSASPTTRPPRHPLRRLLLLAALLALVIWLIHPMVVAAGLRAVLQREATRAGLQLEVGDLQTHLARPLVVERLRMRAKDPRVSRTAVNIERVELTLNWPWKVFLGERRWFRLAAVKTLRGVFDFGPRPMDPADEDGREARKASASMLSLLPESLSLEDASFEILAGWQSYYLEGVAAEFDERTLGRFTAAGGEVHAGPVVENLGELTGVTAWKQGTVYLADLKLREGIRLDNFQLQLARPGGVALAVEARIFGGSLRGGISYSNAAGDPVVDCAWWMSATQLKPLVALVGGGEKADGVVTEARFTFRGDPEKLVDGQASLRLAADNVRWRNRGWKNLDLGASLSGRRISLSEFSLRQNENSLTANGELTLSDKNLHLAEAPFVLNVTASIQDLGALTGLFGPPYDDLSGRMSLSASVHRRSGEINGFLTVEGSSMGFRNRPIESGRLEVTVANNEAQVSQCELWSGQDSIRGKGTVQLTAPHQYAGDIQGRVEDVTAYLGLLRTSTVLPITAGVAEFRWQGDGTMTSHSGAFQVALDQLVSDWTPSGLTGRFVGTYSPQNVYFSNFELEQSAMRFSTRATLAASGVKLQDILLQARGRELADAAIFLPVDPFALAAGRPLTEAVLNDRPLYANVATRGAVRVRDMLKLAGNDLPAEGTVRINLQATGVPAAPKIAGRLEARGLGFAAEKTAFPLSQIDARVDVAEGSAKLSGEIKFPGAKATAFSWQSPFALQTRNGVVSWWLPTDSITGALDIPRLNLALLRPLFPELTLLKGNLAGQLALGGTFAQPVYDGQWTLENGELRSKKHYPLWREVAASAEVVANTTTFKSFTGQLGGGPFEVAGKVVHTDDGTPEVDLSFVARNALLFDRDGLHLPADIDLQIRGRGHDGTVSGTVNFTDVRFSRRIKMTPVMIPDRREKTVWQTSRWQGLFADLAGDWTLDVAAKNSARFPLGSAPAAGDLGVDLRFSGTLAKPVPVGRLTVSGVRVDLPLTSLFIKSGSIQFLEDDPWMPHLDLRGSGRALAYQVEALAFGALNEGRLILRSDPVLPQNELIALLNVGMEAGSFSKASPVVSLRPFSRQLDYPPGGTVSVVKEPALTGRARLWQTLALDGDPTALPVAGHRLSYRYEFVDPTDRQREP